MGSPTMCVSGPIATRITNDKTMMTPLRLLYFGHRWLGLAICLLLAMWCLSGVVMMYVGFPQLTRDEYYAGLEPLAAERINIGPQQPLAMAGAGAEVLYLDSLSSNAPAAESTNEEAARLFNRLRGLAEARGAVVVLHHVRKPPAGQKTDIGLSSQRGASAIGAVVRCARQCEERKGADGEPSTYLVHTTKCSNAARSGVRAFTITGFRVNDAPTLAPLAELTEAPACRDPFEGIAQEDAVKAWRRICGLPAGKRRADPQAAEWIGYSLAEALSLPCDTKEEKQRISGILKKWCDTGHLKRTTWKETGAGRHGRPVYERGGRDLAAHGD